jgi:hypothetical protein
MGRSGFLKELGQGDQQVRVPAPKLTPPLEHDLPAGLVDGHAKFFGRHECIIIRLVEPTHPSYAGLEMMMRMG